MATAFSASRHRTYAKRRSVLIAMLAAPAFVLAGNVFAQRKRNRSLVPALFRVGPRQLSAYPA
jgi:hypothetical protein